jgi:hypothetical protein
MQIRRLLIAGLLSILLSVVLHGAFVGLHAASLSGHLWSLSGVEWLILIPILSVLALPLCVALAAVPRTRESGIIGLVGALAMTAPLPFSLSESMRLRTAAFARAGERAEPLVRAIERYVDERGRPPQKLRDLVPGYLPAIPDRLPPLEIVTGDVARQHYGGNEWALSAYVPTGLINFDKFLYYPNQAYSAYDGFHSGGLERIGRWAYVHE